MYNQANEDHQHNRKTLQVSFYAMNIITYFHFLQENTLTNIPSNRNPMRYTRTHPNFPQLQDAQFFAKVQSDMSIKSIITQWNVMCFCDDNLFR